MTLCFSLSSPLPGEQSSGFEGYSKRPMGVEQVA